MALPVKDTLELVQQAMEVVKSRYLLCILISQRIHQLEKGAPPVIDVDPDEYTSPKTFLTLSLMEIIEGNMEIETTENASA
ncbi:MAG TPA: DNA-directed RNA polymerase subunit omega [Nitrospinaceae bacterium]|jgi:DNA-directed RNA polymerase subunit K/omega|nr:DNA-directed RNA polymerase subunit omega [Nitrospinaceae bacterium]